MVDQTLDVPVGTVLSVAKPPVTHVGIVVAVDPIRIAHNHPRGRGSAVVDLDGFARGRPVSVVRRPISAAEGRRIARRAQGDLGRRYDLVMDNCETFVQRARGRLPISPSVAVVVGGVLLGAVGAGLARTLAGGRR